METAGAIDTDALINARKIGKVQFLVGFLGGAALLVEGFDTSVIGYIAPQITRLWQVPNSTLGTILTADMVGLLLGYLFLSPLSARFGHKRMVVACTTAFGALTFLTITSSSVAMLIGFRFLTGIGVGGVTTLVLSALFVFALPESLEFLINRGNDRRRAVRILGRMAPELAIADTTRLIAGQQASRKVTVGQLLEDGRALGTTFIWVGMFMNLMIYFFLQKWLTSLLVQVGLSQQIAITATTVGLGGGIVAAFIIGPLMDRFGPYMVVSGLFALSVVSVVAMAQVLSSPEPFMVIAVSTFVGFCLSGGQKANNALSVYFYPTALRGTGLGWALGIGRIGGVFGPFVAGLLLTAGWTPAELFYAASVPAVIGAIAIWLMSQFYGQAAVQTPAAHKV